MVTVIGRCEPEDVLANRLDPWHGAWFHPYSFTALRVLDAPPVDCAPADDRFLVEVTFTVGKRLGVPVRAEFSCPDARTITMEVVDGEGTGSRRRDARHAAAAGPGRPAPHRRDRGGGGALRPSGLRPRVARRRALRPLIGVAARRLWRDDIAYAERRYALRTRS